MPPFIKVSPAFLRRDRGTVLLVSLCFVAVMGLVLGSYLALTTRAMQLSNRGFQAELSKQLAEAGLDEALRAFNKNNWSNWTNGTTPNQTAVNGDITTYAASKRAVATITFPAAKFGQGATATVKLRIDNFDAHVLGSPWNSTKSYQIADVVGYNGMWYSSVRDANTNNTPSDTGPFTWWVPAPIHWQWSPDNTTPTHSDTAYALYDLVNYGGVWYRCVTAATSGTAATIPSLPQNWSSSSISYSLGDVVLYAPTNRLYRCTTAHTSSAAAADLPSTGTKWNTANLYYWLPVIASQPWTASTIYALGDVVNYSGAQYRCTTAHTSAASFNVANWSTVLTPISLSWSSSTYFTKGSMIYYSGAWYYCRQAGSSGTTPNSDSTRWAPILTSAGAPGAPTNADPLYSTRYSVGDYVYRSSTWYRCTVNHVTPASPAATWVAGNWTAAIPYISWAYRNFAPTYTFDDVVYHGTPVWYRYINATASNAVPTGANWENALTVSWDWASGDAYNIGDVVNLSGSFYRCIRAHSNQSPPNTTYWSTEPPFSTYWDAGKSYAANDVARYRGSWYLNLSGSNTRPGTDDDNWAIAPNSVTPWSSTKIYHVDDIVSSGGNWYRCKKDHTNQAVGTDNTHWVQVAGPSRVWSASTAYAANSYVSYGGAWYKCLSATTANAGHSPNNPTYWTPTWAQSAGVTTGAPIVYAEATVTLGDGTTSRTQLRATIDPASLFPNAAGANTTLTISGGTGRVDSYDSELPAVSSDPDGDNYVDTDAGYAAVLAAGTESASGTSTLLSVGASTSVRGLFSAPSSTTTPFAPRASFNTSSDLRNPDGSVTVPDATAANVDLSRLSRSPYVPEFTVQTPIQQTSIPTTLPTPTVPINLGIPGSPTPSVYYFSTNLSIAATETVYINGPVILYINGYLRCNTGQIVVRSTGSALIRFTYLRVYAGSNGFVNLTQDPKKLLLVGNISGTTTNYFDGPFDFYGAVYLPDTTATLGLDIQTGNEIFGALSAREITFSTEANLHYDTSLRYATFPGVDQPYTVTEWRELPTTEAATLP